jgi:hypothetical protein
VSGQWLIGRRGQYQPPSAPTGLPAAPAGGPAAPAGGPVAPGPVSGPASGPVPAKDASAEGPVVIDPKAVGKPAEASTVAAASAAPRGGKRPAGRRLI